MKKRLFSIFISLTMVTGLFPVTVAFAAEEEGFNGQKYEEKVGISSVPTQTYDELGFNTGYTDLEKQANDPYSPYGKGVTNLVTQHEIFAVSGDASENFDPYIVDNKSDILMPEDADDFKLTYPLNLGPHVIAQRSVSFDPNGTGKPDHIASVYLADAGNNATIMYIAYGNTQWTKTELLNGLPFEVLPEQAGAYLSIAAGNFDGDDKGTEEIAFYRPNYNFGNQTEYKSNYNETEENTYSGSIELRKLTGKNSSSVLNVVKSFNLREQSQYYFYDNSDIAYAKGSFDYVYRYPAVSVEAISQQDNLADDLCITYSAVLGGQMKQSVAGQEIKAKTPYDCATGVFFWMNPLTAEQKRTGTVQMRFNWKDDYGVTDTIDKNAANKWEVMTFGSPGAGDINNDGYNEVVVGGYLFAFRDQVMDGKDVFDWRTVSNEFAVTYFTYDAAANTYRLTGQPMNWINLYPSNYHNLNNLRAGFGPGVTAHTTGKYDEDNKVYHYDYDDEWVPEHAVWCPLDITCFADRGSGYAESVSVGGIIARLDTGSTTSAWTPYKELQSKMFDLGVFNPAYAIPTETIQQKHFSEGSIQRFITESVAVNIDGNLLGQEQLLFGYTARNKQTKEHPKSYQSAYGIISQIHTGDQDIDYTSNSILFDSWGVTVNNPYKPISIAAPDVDDDSILMRHSGEPNDYFFSDPRILAVLQAPPYFKEFKNEYADTGETNITFTQGSAKDTIEWGVTFSTTAQGGYAWESLSGSNGASVLVGAFAGVEETRGTGESEAFGQGYTAGTENEVALVMTPYVRYHYEVLNDDKRTWSPMDVDVPQQPRATIITVAQYDEAAKNYNMSLIDEKGLTDEQRLAKGELHELAWGYISSDYVSGTNDDKVLTNVAGKPASYGDATGNKTNFRGARAVNADTVDDFVRVGSGGTSSMQQTMSFETSDFTDFSWEVGGATNEDFKIHGFQLAFSQQLGHTSGYTKTNFTGTEFTGEVVSIPEKYKDYTFLWRLGRWSDSLMIQGMEQNFPVVGYLVKSVMQPEPGFPADTEDPILHVSKNEANAIHLAWKNSISNLPVNTDDSGYVLYRYQHETYHPLAMLPAVFADDGWFRFTDVNAKSAFEQYGYAVRPYAIKSTGEYVYGPYSKAVDGYTMTNDINRPYVTVEESESIFGKTYRANVSPATGDVDHYFCQWQVYEPENGGWIDLKDGYGATVYLVSGKTNLEKEYRCKVTQRGGDRVYITYSDVYLPGFVFVADKSRQYEKDGKKVVDYVLVHENGTVEVVASPNVSYSAKHVYLYGYDEDGNLFLEESEKTRSVRTVDVIDHNSVDTSGSGGNHTFTIPGSAKVLDVEKLYEAAGKSSAPLLQDGTDTKAVVKTLPAVTEGTLAEGNRISYSMNEDNSLRAAFIYFEEYAPPKSSSSRSGGTTVQTATVTVKLLSYDVGYYLSDTLFETLSFEELYADIDATGTTKSFPKGSKVYFAALDEDDVLKSHPEWKKAGEAVIEEEFSLNVYSFTVTENVTIELGYVWDE